MTDADCAHPDGICVETICFCEYCGDGELYTGEIGNEECDDGNTSNGDGCSSTCEWEIPACTLTVDDDEIYSGTEVSFTISNVDTGWESAAYLDYGDGQGLTGPQLSPDTNEHTYTGAAVTYTATVTVVNAAAQRSGSTITGSCVETVSMSEDGACGYR